MHITRDGWAACAAGLCLITTASGQTVLVSLDSAQMQSNQICFEPAVSQDGRHVFFMSRNSNLIPGGAVGQQVYARDRDPDGNGILDEGNGTTTLMSIALDGSPGADLVFGGTDGGLSGFYGVDCSDDGRYVIFSSRATNLIANDTTGRPHFDVFRRDRDPDANGIFDEGNGVTLRVTEAVIGTEANTLDNGADQIGISGDGRYIVFSSSSTNLIMGDTTDNGLKPNIYVRDMQSATTERVDWLTSDFNSGSRYPQISADGRWIVYADYPDIFVSPWARIVVVDRISGGSQWVEVSVTDTGGLGDGHSGTNPNSHGPRISADGRVVVFHSVATNLDITRPNDTPVTNRLYVHDRDADGDGIFDEPGAHTTRRIDVNEFGDGANASSLNPAISDDGDTILFQSVGNNLLPIDATPSQISGHDVYRYDRPTATVGLASRAEDGTQGLGVSTQPALSGDGVHAVYASTAGNLVPNDTNSRQDIFDTLFIDRCVADWNQDDVLNTADFLAYLNDYNAAVAGQPTVYDDPDLAAPIGVLNTADFIAYLNAFNAGC